jgi:Tfp pilus assembly protein PilN
MSFLLANWKLVIIAVLVAFFASTVVYMRTLKSNIAVLEAEKTSLVVKLEVSNASIAALQSVITEQNLAVEKFKEDAETRAKAAQGRIAKAKIESSNQQKKAATIMNRAIPKDSTACDAANHLFNEEIRDAK